MSESQEALEDDDIKVGRRHTTSGTLTRSKLSIECGRRHTKQFLSPTAGPDGRDQVKQRMHPAQDLQTPGAVLSVWGKEPDDADRFVPYGSRKAINYDGSTSRMSHCVGVVSNRGHKPDQPNQDDFFVLSRRESLLFGVLDGHGPHGHHVSHFAQEQLPRLMVERLRAGNEWEMAVGESVEELSASLQDDLADQSNTSGSTMSVAMLDRPNADIAHLRLRCSFLGDSIIIYARRSSPEEPWELRQLTDIHRPDRPDERERIEQAGGAISEGTSPRSSARLVTPNWTLAMSRSLGDFHTVPYGLSHEPEFPPETHLDLAEGEDHMVLICSDGVWDVIPPLQAVNIVGKFSPEDAQAAAERLVSKAQLRWQQLGDSVDDITAILVRPMPDVPTSPTASAALGSLRPNIAG